ncbi:MAG: flagellar biosynthetic protein FliO [Planctomycetaceae bacterium]
MRFWHADLTTPLLAIGRVVVRSLWAVIVGLAVLSGPGAAKGLDRPSATASAVANHSPPTPSAGAPSAEAQSKTPIVRSEESDPTAVPRTRNSPWGTLAVVGTLLAGLYLVSRWLKSAGPTGWSNAAPQAVNLLGTTPITPQSAVHVIQVGERLLVVGSGPGGLHTLTELTDPAEVAHLAHLCRSQQSLPSGWNPLAALGLLRERPAQEVARVEQPLPAANDADNPAADVFQHLRPSSRSASKVAGWLLALLLTGTPVFAQTPPLAESKSIWSRAEIGTVSTSPRDVFNERSTATAGEENASIQRLAYEPDQAADRLDPVDTPETATSVSSSSASSFLELASPQGLGGSLRLGLLVGVMSLAPAILLMTTCYVRFIVVFGLVRQAIGVQQFPPTQVLTALSLFLTGLVMWPVWTRSWQEGIAPYAASDAASTAADFPQAITRTAAPVREFMSRQIEASGNSAAIDLLMSYQANSTGTQAPELAYYEDVPLPVLLPAYVLSELKTAFLIGFQLYLPFVVIDLLVSSVLTSLGLGMLSPGVVSLPFKLLLFVLIDGWFLLVEVLLQGIPPLS